VPGDIGPRTVGYHLREGVSKLGISFPQGAPQRPGGRADVIGGASGYPNVNAYASAPGSRNVISSVRSRTASCSRASW
jgi:hypothetical protein